MQQDKQATHTQGIIGSLIGDRMGVVAAREGIAIARRAGEPISITGDRIVTEGSDEDSGPSTEPSGSRLVQRPALASKTRYLTWKIARSAPTNAGSYWYPA